MYGSLGLLDGSSSLRLLAGWLSTLELELSEGSPSFLLFMLSTDGEVEAGGPSDAL
jgi:hypothetical protein